MVESTRQGQRAEPRLPASPLLPVLTAYENVELPLHLVDLSRAERRESAETMLGPWDGAFYYAAPGFESYVRMQRYHGRLPGYEIVFDDHIIMSTLKCSPNSNKVVCSFTLAFSCKSPTLM